MDKVLKAKKLSTIEKDIEEVKTNKQHKYVVIPIFWEEKVTK